MTLPIRSTPAIATPPVFQAKHPEEGVVLERYEGVTSNDIAKAQSYGVMAALKRHLDKSPEERVDAALEIMEGLHATGYKEKVWFFVELSSARFYEALVNPAKKAEFAIRVAQMYRGKDRLKWLMRATELTEHCPRKTLIALAHLEAACKHPEQTLHWLSQTQADCEEYKNSAFILYQQGAFREGLSLMRAGYGEVAHNEDDFVELFTYGLLHPEILKEKAYIRSLQSFKLYSKHEDMILKGLCACGNTRLALDLAEKITLRSKYHHVYHFLILSDYIQSPEERIEYIARLTAIAIRLDALPRTTTGAGPLYEATTSKFLTVTEAFEICEHIPKVSLRLSALWERACSITVRWGLYIKARELRNPSENHNLQSILQVMRTHLMQSAGREASEYWIKVLRDQLNCGFIEDIDDTFLMWREWTKCRPSSSADAYILCHQALYALTKGQIQEAQQTITEAHQVYYSKDQKFNGFHWNLSNAARHFLWSREYFNMSPAVLNFFNKLRNNKFKPEQLLGEGLKALTNESHVANL